MISSRRRIRLALLVALGAGGWFGQQRRSSAREPGVAVPWPPLPPNPTPNPTPTRPFTTSTEAVDPSAVTAWVGPDDGACPDTHPVKVKLRSGLFHKPGMAWYNRTKADRCYSSADGAEAHGFRPSSR